MNYFQATIFSLVQGISEFLPISSKGHLNLSQYLLGVTPSLSFDIFLNTATLLSVIFYFRHQIPYFFKNLRYIVVGTIPAVILGFLLKHQFESLFSNPGILPYFFLITAAFLIYTKFFKQKDEPLSYSKALIIGLLQSLALIPGVSRSGSTIFAGLLVGLSSINAFNFSFSLFIPASLGALILDIKDVSNLASYGTPVYLYSFALTAIIGYFSLKFLRKVLVGHKFWIFGIYLVVLSLVSFFVL